jgi:hypothetical protein
MLTRTTIGFVAILALVACNKKKDDAPAGDNKPATTETKPAAKPTEAKPAGPVDVAQLTGSWTRVDKPDIVWTFNADGTDHIKTSFSEFPGTFKLEGNALSMKSKDVAGGSEYVVVEVTANKLRVKDKDSSTITEFKK